MKVIVDSNIVFSGILNTESKIGDLLLNSQEEFKYYSCEHLKDEISNHKEKLLELSGYTEEEFESTRDLLYNCLTFIAEREIPFEYWQ